MLYQTFSSAGGKTEDLAYKPDFTSMVENGKVRELTIVNNVNEGTQHLRIESTELDEKTNKPKQFRTDVIVTDQLLEWLEKQDVKYSFDSKNPFLMQFLGNILPFLLVLGLLYFLFSRQMRGMGKSAMSFGKSRAKLLSKGHTNVTFKDVAGVDEAREEVQEIVEFLKAPKKFQRLGGKIPKGVLLIGPPGTGKTLLAKAISGEADVPFFSISGSDFVEMFVGVGASRVRDMFVQGKKSAPCIIFIDEIDAIGRTRFSGVGGGHDEREQTLNAILVEMDGIDTTEGVIMLAATNRPDVLDSALLRPGRFDRQINVDLPTLEGRYEILKIHAEPVKISKDADLHRVARGTPGFSGADLSNLINEAALLAARRDADQIEQEDFDEARDKVRWGRERRGRVMDDTQKRLTAYHEAGHAVVLQTIAECDPLHKVTIIPRGQALGATMQLPENDEYTQSRSKLTGIITGMLGGRVAEEIIFGDVTTGGQNDFKQATHIARMMVCEWGMSDLLGPQNFGEQQELLFLGREVNRSQKHSEQTAQKIDAEITRIITEAHDRAKAIVEEHKDDLETIASLLIERESLNGNQIKQIIETGELSEDDKPDEVAGSDHDSPTDPEEADEDSPTESEESVQSDEDSKPKEEADATI
jgi:cell division protease FtsH